MGRAVIWRNWNLLGTVLGRSVSEIGNAITVVALMLRMHDAGGSGWWIAGLLLADMLPIVLLAPVAGLVADRYDSRRLLLATSVVQASVCVALAFVHAPYATLGLVALLATGNAFGSPVFGTLVPRLVPADQLPKAYDLLQSSTMLAGMAGMGLGGLLTGAYGHTVPLLVDAVTFLAITAIALLIRVRARASAPEGASDRAREGFTLLLADRPLAAVVLMGVSFAFVLEAVNVVEVFLVRDTLGGSEAEYGAVLMTWTIGAVVGSALVGRLNGSRQLLRAITLSFAGLGGIAVLIAGTPSIGWLFAVYVVGGVINGLANAATGALIPLRIAEAFLGRANAAFSAMIRASGLGALAIGGLLADVLTPRQLFAACGVAGLLVVLGALPLLRRSGDRAQRLARTG